MAQITTSEKVQNNQKITDGKIKIYLRKIIHPLLLMASQSKVNFKIVKENKYKVIKNKPIIFAINHQCVYDTPIACKAIKKHGYILSGKQPFEKIDELFFNLNGSIFVDRKDKKDMALSKDAMVEYLKKGQNIIMFPEGTWNMTDQELMLNMKWGIIEVAKETNAQIIPVVLNYDRDNNKCSVVFGQTMVIEKDRDKKEAIEELRDEMASLRWKAIDETKIYKREEIDVEDLRKKKEAIYDEYPMLDVEYEKSVIFKPTPTAEEVFAPVKKLGLRKDTAFLYGKNKTGIW